MGRLREFHCPACAYTSGLLADGAGMRSIRDIFHCRGCRRLVSLATGQLGEGVTPGACEAEHIAGGCAAPALAIVSDDDPITCPRCGQGLAVVGVGLWD